MPRWLNRNVWGMTITSLLSDACYEMVLAVLPGFLPIIHVAAAALGYLIYRLALWLASAVSAGGAAGLAPS